MILGVFIEFFGVKIAIGLSIILAQGCTIPHKQNLERLRCSILLNANKRTIPVERERGRSSLFQTVFKL